MEPFADLIVSSTNETLFRVVAKFDPNRDVAIDPFVKLLIHSMTATSFECEVKVDPIRDAALEPCEELIVVVMDPICDAILEDLAVLVIIHLQSRSVDRVEGVPEIDRDELFAEIISLDTELIFI